MALVEKYGTPLRLTYLPKISTQIQRAKQWFADGIAATGYQGSYSYAYCTKSSHFRFVLEEALKNDVHLETSSWFDTNIIRTLHAEGKVSKDKFHHLQRLQNRGLQARSDSPDKRRLRELHAHPRLAGRN